MKTKRIAILTGLLFSSILAAQEVPAEVVPVSFLDSIKQSFVHHEIASCVDNRWIQELIGEELFEEMLQDIEEINLEEVVEYDLSTDLLKERLRILDARSAFDIEYNPGLENIIKHYLKNRKKTFERLIGLSEYYFPIFEEALARYNVPLEIKYLAVVESALNPRAVSRMGATGLWQFMYGTGKQYQLDISTFVDERSDPLKSSDAACQYMVNMYKIFGDWDLVLASYNAGPGNVTKAIRRSGGKQNYWNIRPYLPRETQGYVPAFLATMYVYEFHKEHGIVPQKFEFNHFTTDTVKVKDKMTFKQISDLLDISIEELRFLNPVYKRDVVPYIQEKDHYLKLPLDKIAVFTSNEEKIYAYTNYDFSQREKPFEQAMAMSGYKYHTVRKGESLGLIAKKHKVSVNDIKRWNSLKSNTIQIGKKLRIETYEPVVSVPKPTAKKNDKETSGKETSETESVATTHKVSKGETISGIAEKYNLTVDKLKAINKLETNLIKEGQILTVKIIDEDTKEVTTVSEKEERTLINHVVLKNENLGELASRYGVSVEEIKEWNQLAGSNITAGSTLKIYTEKRSIVPEENDNLHQTINKKQTEEQYYVVKKGDSLYSISQKLPGVSVADLKKWNGISGTEIKPGMKLRING